MVSEGRGVCSEIGAREIEPPGIEQRGSVTDRSSPICIECHPIEFSREFDRSGEK
ncbi:hypothetical protein V0288_08425 [Pannus brasiliensis CCIBt3594]|uniref:Uncharacterized protein n=1 Tax=Pannus brasiliensis CCIBt3594 TaxID=1427578 RepID=A0AAW9QQV2_9CHRO